MRRRWKALVAAGTVLLFLGILAIAVFAPPADDGLNRIRLLARKEQIEERTVADRPAYLHTFTVRGSFDKALREASIVCRPDNYAVQHSIDRKNSLIRILRFRKTSWIEVQWKALGQKLGLSPS